MRGSRFAVMFVTVALALGALAMPAAAETVRCADTTIEGGTITGELRVPADRSCVLDGVTVAGDVFVARGADLFATGVTVTGTVDVRADAYAEFEDSDLHGEVIGRNSFALLLFDSDVGDDVTTNATDALFVFDSALGGSLDIRGGPDQVTEAFLDSSTVASNVRSQRAQLTDVFDSTIDGTLDVANAADGSIVCTSEVDGRARFAGSAGPLLIGSGTGCDTNYFGQDLVVLDHAGAPEVVGSIIRGDLRCEGNETAPVVEDNRVRGEALGQCAEVGIPEAQAFGDVASDGDDRRDAALEGVEQRRQDAGR